MKKIFTILGIALLLLVSGCASGTGDAKNNGYNLGGAFNGGDDAVNVEFTEGQPPSKIRDGGLQPFNIRVLIENVGENDIEEGVGHVSLSGISFEDFGIAREDASKAMPALRGVKKQGENIIDGGKQPVMFSGLKYVAELPSGVHTQQFAFDICYPYETKSLASVCISGNTLQSFDNDLEICELEGEKKYANSGAPVQIENVKQNPAGQSSIQLQFDIVHKGTSENGRIYKSASLDNECKVNGDAVSSTEASLEENYVLYTVDAGNLAGIDCGSSGTNSESVLLTNDKTTVYCTIDTTGQEDFEKPVNINLKYDYFDRITTQIEIEHIEK